MYVCGFLLVSSLNIVFTNLFVLFLSKMILSLIDVIAICLLFMLLAVMEHYLDVFSMLTALGGDQKSH